MIRSAGRLQRGETITLEDGSVVQPEDVMAASKPGKVASIGAALTSTYATPQGLLGGGLPDT